MALPHGPVVHQTQHARAVVYRLEHALAVPLSPYPGRVTAASYDERLRLRALWRSRAAYWWRRWTAATAGLACIHQGEGAWNANTGNGYFGGLQMSLSFQAHWGPWVFDRHGTADRWRAFDQLRVGLKAAREIGYGPWPNTAARCGLL